MAKVKMMVTGKKEEQTIQVGRFPFEICGVGVNSVLYKICDNWYYKLLFVLLR